VNARPNASSAVTNASAEYGEIRANTPLQVANPFLAVPAAIVFPWPRTALHTVLLRYPTDSAPTEIPLTVVYSMDWLKFDHIN